MLKSVLHNIHGVAIAVNEYWRATPSGLNIDGQVLMTAAPSALHGTFKSSTRAAAGTTVVTAPTSNGSLLVTDIIISGEKQAASSTEVRFSDGSNTITLFLAQQADFSVGLAVAFQGRVQGWQNARIEMVTVGTHDTTVTVCYTKVPAGLPFAEWDALR